MTLFCFCRMLLEEPKFQMPECKSVSASSQKGEGVSHLMASFASESLHDLISAHRRLGARPWWRVCSPKPRLPHSASPQPSASLADSKMEKSLNWTACALSLSLCSRVQAPGSARAVAGHSPSSGRAWEQSYGFSKTKSAREQFLVSDPQ